jgi:alpha-tubulin suppressor-like RCC1 family protein
MLRTSLASVLLVPLVSVLLLGRSDRTATRDHLAMERERALRNTSATARLIVGEPERIHVIEGRTVWRSGVVHELAGSVLVTDGGTLIIEAGARIEARPGVFLDVTRLGRVVAAGTALQPIVLSCTSEPQYEGCWGGLTLRGAGALNFGSLTSPAARGNGVAGCLESASGTAGYGGCDPADSSGVLQYVRVEYAAKGLQLLGVGAGTLIDFVQVNRSAGDGLTVVGGSADLSHLFLTANQGYGLSWRSGWRGRGQFISVQQDAATNLGGISGSNEGATASTFSGEPRSAPTLLNVTLIAPPPAMAPVGDGPVAIHLRRGTAGVIRNVLIHTVTTALDIDDSRTCLQTAGTPPLAITNVVIASTTQLGSPDPDPNSCEPYVTPDVEAGWLGDPANEVGVVTDQAVANALIRNVTDLVLPDLRPANGGAAATNPAATPPADDFFDASATFIGAIPVNVTTRSEIPWYAGWTSPAPALPMPGIIAGTVASPTRGPLPGVIVQAALGRETITSAAGAYTLALPAGDHLLTATALPVGCSAQPLATAVVSGLTASGDITVLCSVVAGLSLGAFHGCAVSTDGMAQCWGRNDFGVVGDGTTITPRLLPVLVAGNNVFDASSLSSGYTHSCALRGGRAACWGLNFLGALGVGTAGLFAAAPVDVGNSGTPSFTRISTGGYHACALTAAGVAWCWGWNQEGQAGSPPTTASVLIPAPVPAGPLTFTQITAGESHTCALTATGEAWCWGGNGRGELGTDPDVLGTASATPVLVPGGHVFAQLDAGTMHTCGVTTAGVAYCWGSQELGQLGNGVVGGRSDGPVLVSGSELFLQLSAGGHTTCGVTTAHAVQCWGSGTSGVLGNGTTTATQATPVAVSGSLVADGVVVNLSEPAGATACAFTSDGDAFCWGAGGAGQLGNGALGSSAVPIQVLIRGPS